MESVEDYPDPYDKSESEDEETPEEDQEEQDVKSKDIWRDIVSEACSEFKNELLTRADQVLLEPFLSEFIEHMKEYVEENFRFVKMMEQDAQYEKIDNMIQQFEEEDYDREEAADSAWHNRRFLVKRMIEDNIDLVAKIVDGDQSDASE